MKQPEVEAVEVAGPGFINIRLRAAVAADILRAVLEPGGD
jgi:arginyl-tRNA synthetase